jgi:hypothetical protein
MRMCIVGGIAHCWLTISWSQWANRSRRVVVQLKKNCNFY